MPAAAARRPETAFGQLIPARAPEDSVPRRVRSDRRTRAIRRQFQMGAHRRSGASPLDPGSPMLPLNWSAAKRASPSYYLRVPDGMGGEALSITAQ